MFGGVYEVIVIKFDCFDDYGYELMFLLLYEEYIKCFIVKFEKFIGWILYLCYYVGFQESLFNLEVYEFVFDVKFGIFFGYQNVWLWYYELQCIIVGDEFSWKDVFFSVKGVYVIIDFSCGWLYVGLVFGEVNGLWQCWFSYVYLKNFIGGNWEFEQLCQIFGDVYIVENFQYFILEIFDFKICVDMILVCELFWKNVLDSCVYGMNWN